ncbi:MAG: hypothetical protein E7610_07875 [Ruminococcaceae bacterium]|nr:hypothetical protein [Oscillospiraceae bacterium]
MNKKRSILASLLSVLLLTGSLASCATISDEPADTPASDEAATVESETEIKDNLPDNLNYKNETINVISRARLGWFHDEVLVEKLNNDSVNDAVYERNKLVESRLNIRIVNIADDSIAAEAVPDKVSTAVQAGTDEYQIMVAAAYTTADTSLSGIFANLAGTQYIDLEQPWWSAGYNNAMVYDDVQFSATGAMLLTTYRLAFSTVFNKNLFDEANLPYLYDTVEAGEWTLDKQISLIPLFHRDNGNGIQDESGDIYGFVSNDYISVDPYWSACRMDFLGRDADGQYELIMDTGKIHDVSEKILHLYYNTDGGSYILPHEEADHEQETMRGMFAEGFSAMATLRFIELENSVMRNTDQEYGVVPMPKFDESQKDYRTLLHDQFSVVAVPTTVKDERLDMVSAVIEAMASASYKIIKPVYYEETLRTKIAQDPQSAAMMDIITESIYIDAGMLYSRNFEYFHSSLRALINSGVNDATSRFKTIQKKSQTKLNKLNRKLDELLAQE